MNKNSYIRGNLKFTYITTLARCLILLLTALLVFSVGCYHEREIVTTVKANFIDFAPDDGNYDINWPGPPRRAWTEQDKEYYTATIELSQPAPESFKLPFYVTERRFWGLLDINLGWFFADFNVGSTRSQPKFWLVATKKGKIRGNIVKGDDRHAKIYLKDWGYTYDRQLDNWTLDVTANTYFHDVESK